MKSDWPRSGTRIMWMLGESEEDDPTIVESQAEDIADKYFTGVLLVPRAGKFDIRDPRMIDLLEHASLAAKSNGLDVWLMADPRLASDSLIAETGEALEVLIINRYPFDHFNGGNLNTARIENGSYSWEMEYPEIRPTHMLQSGGISYRLTGIERVYVFKRDTQNAIEAAEDITGDADWVRDEVNRIVKVYGESCSKYDNWEVIAFPRFRTNFFDYTGQKSWKLWEEYITELCERIPFASGICWDEPGFYAESGKYPINDEIVRKFKSVNGYDINDNLHWLVLDSPDKIHIKVRNDYFRCLNSIISESMKRNRELSVRVSSIGKRITNGIHATWHGESCGLEEMNHGSLDLWSIRPHQTGSFTDIGGAERLILPETASEIIYSLVLARSLSRMGPNRGLIFSNFWGINFGKQEDDAPVEIIDYWSDLLDLFGARWLAHGYGWPGTRFADLNFGPGYPDHPTWDRFRSVNSRTIETGDVFESGEQISDVLVVFPLESFYAIGHQGGNEIGEKFVELVDTLTRSGYQLDIISPEVLSHAKIKDKKILLNGMGYNSLVLPYCRVIPTDSLKIVHKASQAGIPVVADYSSDGICSPDGSKFKDFESYHKFDLIVDPVSEITNIINPTFELPHGSLGNVRRTPDGFTIHLIPDRPGGRFGGTFRFGEFEIEINERAEPYYEKLSVDCH